MLDVLSRWSMEGEADEMPRSGLVRPPALATEGVGYAYGPIEALSGVSVTAQLGEAVFVIGPNGAGKTTLAKVIGGLLRPRAGVVRIDGECTSQLRACAMPRLGLSMVLEGRHVFQQLPVRANLELGAYSRRLKKATLLARLERVYQLFPVLAEMGSRMAGDLSGGQQQMLCIGRALMNDPRVLVLDEPSMGLSPRIAGAVYSALDQLRKSGLTMLLIEQNASLAFRLCQRGYVLKAGRVVLEGTARELERSGVVREIYLGSGATGEAARPSA